MLSLIAFLAAAALAVEVLLAFRKLGHAATARGAPARLSAHPSVSVIQPIKGYDPGVRENLAATLDSSYPGRLEVLFVFDDEEEPSLPIARELVAERERAPRRGRSARILFAGAPPPERTGKLNAMIAGLRRARGEIVVFADSDIRPDPHALEALVATLLSSERAGSAFAPVYSAVPPRTAGDAGYALLLNGLYGPAAAFAAAKRDGELPFIMGQFMAFTRRSIAAIGGLECAEGQLVDDMFLGARMNAAGLRNMVSPHPVPVIQEGLSFQEFIKVYLRWITFSRSGLPGLSFKSIGYLQGLVFWVGLLGAALVLWTGAHVPLALALSLAPVGVCLSLNAFQVMVGGAPLGRWSWVSALLLLISPFVLVLTFVRRRVSWRGRTYSLDRGARLREGGGLPAAASGNPLLDRRLSPGSRAP
jgi:ceramide glucosyltransferase